MKRTKLKERLLPNYTKGEEITNMVTHIVGGAFGVAYLVLCVVFSAIHHNPWGVVSSAIYGASVLSLFTLSSVYHGLVPSTAKKVLQVLDHCTIYFMIAGTYTPITLCSLRPDHPALGWTLFGLVWGVCALAVTLTAIDLKKYSKFSMICYIAMGWCVVIGAKPTVIALTAPGTAFILIGDILYTIGAILYGIGKKKKYVHSVFHVFVVVASLMHFFCIFFYVI